MSYVEIDVYRHGISGANANNGLVVGRLPDEGLTDLGQDQAVQLGEFQVANGLRPDIAFTSPLKRTQETGMIALNTFNGQAPILRVSHQLTEHNRGDFEGKTISEIFTPTFTEQLDMIGSDYRYQGGESTNDVANRMALWLRTAALTALRADMKRVSGYSHHMAIVALITRLHGVTDPVEVHQLSRSILSSGIVDFVSRTLIVFENNRFMVEHIGEPTIS